MYCPPNYSERHYKDIKNYTKQAGLFVPLVLCNNFADLNEISAHLQILHNANVRLKRKISLAKQINKRKNSKNSIVWAQRAYHTFF